MTGSPIGDGFGGYLTDGFGSDLLDGYPVASVLPAPRRLAYIVATHFVEACDYAGRRAHIRNAHDPVPVYIPPSTRYNRAQLIIGSQFAEATFAGRAPRRVAIGTVPKPPTPFGTTRRLLGLWAAHFALPEYNAWRLPRRDFSYGGGTGNPPRASQIVVENLLRNEAGARASQVVFETLLQDRTPVRASQTVLETLYRQDNPTFVRASQIVLEVLVPFVEMPLIPVYPELEGLGFEVVKRPKFSTGVGVGGSGREIRVNYWSSPQWEWDLTYNVLNDNGVPNGTTASDIKTLIGFFLTCYGSYLPFYFRDPDDYQCTSQALGTGDGVTTSFPFVRTYGLGSFEGTENVGGVNQEETLTIYLNGVAQESGFTINTTTPCGNFVQFSAAPAAGVSITADFQFWYFCRLADDSYDFSKLMDSLWETKKITIFSLKN